MGRGRYANDFSLPGQAYAYILRSPHAHARIAGIDVAAAVDAPGVLAVLTGRDGLALGAAQFAPDRLGLQHLDARLLCAEDVLKDVVGLGKGLVDMPRRRS
jgi:carbon-monoxide dehydrogenase large subunit